MSHPGHRTPQERPLGLKIARAVLRKGFGAKNTESLGSRLRGFFSCKSGPGFVWKSLSLQLWGQGSLAEGPLMHKTGFLSTLPALPFPGPHFS